MRTSEEIAKKTQVDVDDDGTSISNRLERVRFERHVVFVHSFACIQSVGWQKMDGTGVKFKIMFHVFTDWSNMPEEYALQLSAEMPRPR